MRSSARPIPHTPSVHVGPNSDPDLIAAISQLPISLIEREDAEIVIWLGSDPEQLRTQLSEKTKWVQLRPAGVEQWIDSGLLDSSRYWTSAAGAYSETVAEHAIALLLAGVRGLPAIIRKRSWDRKNAFATVGGLHGTRVAVIGTGGVGSAIIQRLLPLGVDVIAINRSGQNVGGARQTVRFNYLDDVIEQIDHLILAAPDTPMSRSIVNGALLQKMKKHSWIVNVGRGTAIDEDALLESLKTQSIGGAALDVTSIEPLPDHHPFWKLDNIIVTPHIANPPALLKERLIERITENIRRYISNEPLLGIIDVSHGY